MTGQVSILNVGTGDTKLVFDKGNVAERIRAARIVTDMIRRGYVMLVEIERDGKKEYIRAKEFREDVCEWIIADFDPVVAQQVDEVEHEEQAETPQLGTEPAKPSITLKRRGRPPGTKSVKAEDAKVVAVPRRAGG